MNFAREAAGNLAKRCEAVKRVDAADAARKTARSSNRFFGFLNKRVDGVRAHFVAFGKTGYCRAPGKPARFGQFTKFSYGTLASQPLWRQMFCRMTDICYDRKFPKG